MTNNEKLGVKSVSVDVWSYSVPCVWCQTPTLDTANAQCWRCLQLSARIARDLPLAKRMVAELSRPRAAT